MENITGIGVDLGGTFMKYGIVDQKGTILWHSKKLTDAKISKEKVLQNINSSVMEALVQAKQLNLLVESVGIGTPGLVANNNTVVGGADNIKDWIDVPLGNIVGNKVGLPTMVANDADMMAFGEFWHSGKEDETILFFTLGTGIGGAMIINGDLFQGNYGFGGELGVFPMVINGEVKYWEDVASTKGLIDSYISNCGEITNSSEINGEYIIEKYHHGNSLAQKVINETTDFIGMGLAGYINVFNPGKIIIGGGISEAGDFFIKMVKDNVQKYALPACLNNVEILQAKLGNKAGIIGAALFSHLKARSANIPSS